MTDPGGIPAPDPAERRVLIVDDDRSIRDTVSRFLKARGFEVEASDTVASALDRLRTTRFGTLLCDVRMPGTSGIALVPAALNVDADLAILMLTGLNDASAATEALSHGAMDYLLKPIELNRLEDAIIVALRRRHERMAQRAMERPLRDNLAARAAELELQKRELTGVTLGVIDAIVALLEGKSPHHAGHAHRVAELSGAVARSLDLDADTVALVVAAARVHDVGNVGVAESVLHKPAPLTAGEYAAVRRHVRIGLEILAPIDALKPVVPFVRDHHERWAGGGYPSDIKGAAISIGGRILAAADAYVAITSGRAYTVARPPAGALAHLAPHAGTHFDPDVFRALQHVVRSRLA